MLGFGLDHRVLYSENYLDILIGDGPNTDLMEFGLVNAMDVLHCDKS